MKVLSGSALKVLAMVSMLTDHLALFLWKGEPWCQSVLFSLGHREITVYTLLRMFGRIAFPLFAFLLVKGRLFGYAFYLFYPLHLLVIYLIRQCVSLL